MNMKENGMNRKRRMIISRKNSLRFFNPLSEPRGSLQIDRLLLEEIPLAGIARVLKLSQSWLQGYVKRCYEALSHQVQVLPKLRRALSVQMDELWSFVDDKGNKQWVWLVLDVATREIVGGHIGDRSGDSALALWQSMPAVYRQCAMIYTDHWEAYRGVLPSKRHRAVGKETGLTSYIERFNNTLRQRVSRLVRKTLSFSKKLENHIGAIWNFIHYYNELIRLVIKWPRNLCFSPSFTK
jgi:insertion element IS1 protein InsB